MKSLNIRVSLNNFLINPYFRIKLPFIYTHNFGVQSPQTTWKLYRKSILNSRSEEVFIYILLKYLHALCVRNKSISICITVSKQKQLSADEKKRKTNKKLISDKNPRLIVLCIIFLYTFNVEWIVNGLPFLPVWK